MSNITVKPSQLNGTVTAPPSKSDVHRAVICAALSGGRCRIAPVALSNDIKATIGCIEALGAKTSIENGVLSVDSTAVFSKKTALLDCGESGSTLRFFVPVAAAGGVKTEFVGHGSLVSRPIGLFADILPEAGVECDTTGVLPLRISGQLRSGTFTVPGNISSQFITGLLFALPLLDGDSKIVLTTPLESEAYVDMTIRTMSRFGVRAERTDYGYFVSGNQRYTAQDYRTDGDWSQAAFFMAAGALCGEVTVDGVDENSTQGDKQIVDLLRRFGAEVKFENNSVSVKKAPLKAIDIDARQIPDLVPILSVVASFAEGTTTIHSAERLRIKESDRIKTTAAMLNALGGNVEEKPDGLVIHGCNNLKGGTVDGSNDHRIVMSASVAALCADGEVTITDMESINKSFPNYFEEYDRLGGISDVELR